MGWSLSTFLDTQPFIEALFSALKHGMPEIINSDQGCQFTTDLWVNTLKSHNISISIDGKGHWVDNVYIERLWGSIKYETFYLHAFETVKETYNELEKFIAFYHQKRFHQTLNYHTPEYVFKTGKIPSKKELYESFILNKSYTPGVVMK